jgi:hypothetical protein
MRHFQVEAKHLRATLPAVEMENLLQERKTPLQARLAERFRQARESGTTADVALLSATLRALKRQLASLDARATTPSTPIQ